ASSPPSPRKNWTRRGRRRPPSGGRSPLAADSIRVAERGRDHSRPPSWSCLLSIPAGWQERRSSGSSAFHRHHLLAVGRSLDFRRLPTRPIRVLGSVATRQLVD